MHRLNFAAVCRLFTLFLIISVSVFAQGKTSQPAEVTIVSEEDLIPSVLKNLPDYANVRQTAVYVNNVEDLNKNLGEQPVLRELEFTGGTGAAIAQYDAGKLLLIEFLTPQIAAAADNNFKQRISENPQNPPVYRRIGNYSAFVFNPSDEASANALLDQIKYSKTVQWLGSNPHALRRAEEAFARTTGEIFLSTFLAIGLALLGTFLTGVIIGFIFFNIRKRKRAAMTKFSDAGGMTRLNLDDLTEMTASARMLGE